MNQDEEDEWSPADVDYDAILARLDRIEEQLDEEDHAETQPSSTRRPRRVIIVPLQSTTQNVHHRQDRTRRKPVSDLPPHLQPLREKTSLRVPLRQHLHETTAKTTHNLPVLPKTKSMVRQTPSHNEGSTVRQGAQQAEKLPQTVPNQEAAGSNRVSRHMKQWATGKFGVYYFYAEVDRRFRRLKDATMKVIDWFIRRLAE